MGLNLLMLGGLAAVFLGLAAFVALALMPGKGHDRQRRVSAIEQYVSGVRTSATTKSKGSVKTGLVELGERVMAKGSETDKVMSLIQRADLPMRSGEWGVVRIVSAVLVPLVLFAFLHGGLLTFISLGVGLVLGIFAPSMILKFLAKRRCNKFERQMPDVLMLVASSLSTGFSLMQALDAVSQDVAEPARKEFARVMAETRIGAPVEDALGRMAERMDSDNMRWTSMAISIQRQVGGNLAETLRKTATTLRDREALRRQVRALSAEGRLSAYILIGLPIGLFVFLANSNRSYIELLWTNPIGIGMLAGCVVSMAIGTLWMNKLVKVEV